MCVIFMLPLDSFYCSHRKLKECDTFLEKQGLISTIQKIRQTEK
jgi:hypothetical protein